MTRKRTIVLDGDLCDVLEDLYKNTTEKKSTWNDVIARLIGYEDFDEFNKLVFSVKLANTKSNTKRCDKTLDMFDEE